MRNLRKNILGLCLVGMGLGVGAPAQAASGIGPYYAMPSWDQTLPAATRFIVLTNMGSEAVLDRETGLVWEQSPDTTPRVWMIAHLHCNQKTVGGRKGWRLPGIQDLASLIDPAVAAPGPTLPAGHPFSNVQSSFYWAATSTATTTAGAWTVRFSDGGVFNIAKSLSFFAWCVRGGQGLDAQ